MFVQTGTTTVIDSVIESNTASLHGGNISINAGRTSIVSSTISNKTATGNGGGLRNGTEFLTSIIGSNFADKNARRGGGLYARRTVETANRSFRNNTARDDGGGSILCQECIRFTPLLSMATLPKVVVVALITQLAAL